MLPGPGVVHEGRDATAGEEGKGGAGASGRVLTGPGQPGISRGHHHTQASGPQP